MWSIPFVPGPSAASGCVGPVGPFFHHLLIEEMQQSLDRLNYKIRLYEDGAMTQAAMEERQARSPEG